jgi:capsular polysaccharide transport system permease protein
MRGLVSQLQVVHALLIRETKTRFGTHHLGYLWALVQPSLWIAMFVVVDSLFGRTAPPGMSLIAFLTTGIVPFSLFRETTNRCLSAIDANKGLLFYPQVRPLDLVLARALLEFATHVVIMALFLGGLSLIEGPPQVESWLATLGGISLAGGLGGAFGLLCCGLAVFSESVERILPAVIRPLLWVSAVFHPVESLPNAARDALLWNPLVHAIELVRGGWFPGYHARHADPWYVVSWILTLSAFGLTVERTARRRLQVS